MKRDKKDAEFWRKCIEPLLVFIIVLLVLVAVGLIVLWVMACP